MSSKRPRPTGPTGLEALGEIGSRLGEILGAVQATIEKAGDKAADGETQRDFTVETSKGPLKGSVGWRVKVGGLAGGSASGDAGSTAERAEMRKTPTEKPVREPLVDVFVEADHVLVIAEMPGVAAKDIALRFTDAALIIESTGANRFRAEIALPATVDRDAAPAKALRNGILELRFKTRS